MPETTLLAIPEHSPHSLAEGVPVAVTVGGKNICILRRGPDVFAFAATCPHAGGRFCEGWTDARGLVVCPLHKYRFDPANGRNVSGEGYKLKTYGVEIRGDSIFVAL